MSIINKSYSMLIGSIIGVFLAAMESIIISRYLGPGGVGRYQLAITLCITVVTLFSFGIGQANIYFINIKRFSVDKLATNSILYATVIGIISSPLLFMIFILGNDYTGTFSIYIISTMSLCIIFTLMHVFLGQMLIAQMKILQFNLSSLISKFISIVLFLIVAINGVLNTETAVVIYVIYNFLAACLSCYFIQGAFCYIFNLDRVILKNTLFFGLKYHWVNLLNVLDQNLATIFICIMLPGQFDGIGYFTRAIAICTFIRFIPVSLSNLLFAHWAKHNISEMTRQLEKAVRIYTCFASIICAFNIIFGYELICLFYGSAFLPALPLLKILSIQQILWVASSAFQSFYFAAGKPSFVTLNLIITYVVDIIAIIFLIPYIGLIGVAIAMTLGQMINVIINIYIGKNQYSLIPLNCFKIGISDIKYIGFNTCIGSFIKTFKGYSAL
jgi:O-antigen/teichoic acid export membrane protein